MVFGGFLVEGSLIFMYLFLCKIILWFSMCNRRGS